MKTLATLITAAVLAVSPAAAFASPGDSCTFTDDAGLVVEGVETDAGECVAEDGRSSWGRSSWGRSSWG